MSHIGVDRMAAFDDLALADREAVLEHAATCASCRAALLDEAPWRQFAFLSLQPIPVDALERLAVRLDRALDSEAPPASAPRQRSRYAFASVAAAVLLAGVFSVSLLRHPAPMDPDGGLLAPSFRASRAGAIRPAAKWVDDAIPGIEVLESPSTAQVLDLSVGETQVVMIFDEELGI